MFGPVPCFAHRLGSVVGSVVMVILASTVPATPAMSADRATPTLDPVRYAGHRDAADGSFVVVLKDGEDGKDGPATGSAAATAETARTLAERYDLDLRFTYTAALKGMAVRNVTEQRARQLAADPAVAYVAQDLKVGVAAPQAVDCPLMPCVQSRPIGFQPPAWHDLDRVDQRRLPLDGLYHYRNTAQGVRVFVIDSGIRYSHQEFGGRAVNGVDVAAGPGASGNDCNGHGTHVAGTIGGSVFGLAKQVTLVSVRVFDCTGSGSYAAVIAGVDWVTGISTSIPQPSVANLSVEGAFYSPLASAVNNSINANVHYSIAAGNSGQDACLYSGNIPRATTVAASDSNDARAPFSNVGRCVDLYAPGVGVTSTWWTLDGSYNTMSGTSTATAHVTGAAALYRYRFPAIGADQLAAALAADATPNAINGNPPGTPNLLIFTGAVPA